MIFHCGESFRAKLLRNRREKEYALTKWHRHFVWYMRIEGKCYVMHRVWRRRDVRVGIWPHPKYTWEWSDGTLLDC